MVCKRRLGGNGVLCKTVYIQFKGLIPNRVEVLLHYFGLVFICLVLDPHLHKGVTGVGSERVEIGRLKVVCFNDCKQQNLLI